MAREKIAITLDENTIVQLDRLVRHSIEQSRQTSATGV